MKKLTNEELEYIEGGVSGWVAIGIVAVVVFLSGVIKGIVHPGGC